MSSKKIWDYLCPVHGRFEMWSNRDREPCPQCRERSHRQIGSRGIKLPFTDPGFPRAYRVWADEHEKAARPIARSSEE